MVHLWVEKCSDSLENFFFPNSQETEMEKAVGHKHVMVS